MTLKKLIFLFTPLLMALTTFSSCLSEDDIDEIFVGKTWYMVAGELNGTALNTEVKSFYTGGNTAYTISFQALTFVGTLSNGVTFSGTWSVDAKTRELSLNIKNTPNLSLTFDHNIYAVVKNISYYEGDTNILILYQDKENFIRFNYER